ncbi:SMC-Scp complex subunit ScpB, partial [candidate division KSB1 bacterium]
MNLSELKPIVEALVFASDAPVTLERIQETLEDTDAAVIEQVVEELNREYAESGRSFFIRKVGGGYHISTKPEFHSWIKKLFFGRQKYRLTQASMETLAIIAFKQPISRVDIAQIRGVNSDAVVGTLMERKLVTIAGR